MHFHTSIETLINYVEICKNSYQSMPVDTSADIIINILPSGVIFFLVSLKLSHVVHLLKYCLWEPIALNSLYMQRLTLAASSTDETLYQSLKCLIRFFQTAGSHYHSKKIHIRQNYDCHIVDLKIDLIPYY